ncbi:MAG TPA: hypothetical protein DIC18_03480 [Clostridiales bacterium]|nr:hypothetical protein [Clostridiales bacterium]HCU56376.1 hypothetical protein [Clostridiales bacterium]
MKKRFRDSLPSEWLKYLVVTILCVVLWMWFFGMYHSPKDTEKIEVFFAGHVKSGNAFESLAEKQFDYLKSVSIASADPARKNAFQQKYETVGFTMSDVVIVPESVANATQCETAFAELTDMGEAYIQNEISYGVYIPEEKKTWLAQYFDFTEERYVVFAVASSVNSGGKTNHSFDFIEWIVR